VAVNGSVWVAGQCWRCEATDRPVMWLGPVQTIHGAGAFHACELCVRRLEALTLAYMERGVRTD
jgi:hypothetical protein